MIEFDKLDPNEKTATVDIQSLFKGTPYFPVEHGIGSGGEQVIDLREIIYFEANYVHIIEDMFEWVLTLPMNKIQGILTGANHAMSNKNQKIQGRCHNCYYGNEFPILLANKNGSSFTLKPSFRNHLLEFLKFTLIDNLKVAYLTSLYYIMDSFDCQVVFTRNDSSPRINSGAFSNVFV